MITRAKLMPGQKGTKRLVEKYGDKLLCVRYRYDEQSRSRMKTVELVIETKPWVSSAHRFLDSALVPVRIGFRDSALREQAKAAKGRWDPKTHAWYIQFGKIKGTELEKFIILETPARRESI